MPGADFPAVWRRALEALDASGVTLAGLALREPSLDDVFLNLTGHKAEDAPAAEPVAKGRKAKR